jgi:hypothetical protein
MEEKNKKSVLVALFVFIIFTTLLWLFNQLGFRSNVMNFPLFASIYAISLLFLHYVKKELNIKVNLKFVPLLIAASSVSIIIASSQIGMTNLFNSQTTLLLFMFIIPAFIVAYEG